MSFASEETLSSRLIEELAPKFDLTAEEIKTAVHKAWVELEACRNDMRKKGEETVAFLDKTGNRGIVLAGRAAFKCYGSVDVSLPPLCGSKLCKDKR